MVVGMRRDCTKADGSSWKLSPLPLSTQQGMLAGVLSFVAQHLHITERSSQQPPAHSKCSSQNQPGNVASNGAFWARHPNTSAPRSAGRWQGQVGPCVCRTAPGAPPVTPAAARSVSLSQQQDAGFVKSPLPLLAKRSQSTTDSVLSGSLSCILSQAKP